MKRLVMLGALMLAAVLAPLPAKADECSAAGQPGLVLAMCTVPELAARRAVLDVALATALGGLGESAAAEVMASDMGWIGFAERACSPDAEPLVAVPEDEDGRDCLVRLFDVRIGVLERSRMLGGFRFYTPSRYLAFLDPEAEPDSMMRVTQKELHGLRMDGESALAAGFNSAMEALDAGHLGLFAAPGEEDADASSDASVTVSAEEAGPARISVRVEEHFFGHGAAHGNYAIGHRHFLVGEQRLLQAGDIFVGDNWGELLAGLVLTRLKADLGDGLWEDLDASMPEWMADTSRWSFAPGGLGIQFQPYEVTAYAFGAPVAVVPWSALDAVTQPEASPFIYNY